MSRFDFSKHFFLFVMYNQKRKIYFIKLLNPFSEVDVFHDGLTKEIVEENKNNPEFFYNEFFKQEKGIYQDEDWHTSADYIDRVLEFRGDINFSGDIEISLMEREENNIKHQVLVVKYPQEDTYEDKRNQFAGFNIYSLRTNNLHSQKKGLYTDINAELMKELFCSTSQKTAASALSDIFDWQNQKLIHTDWNTIDSKSMEYSF